MNYKIIHDEAKLIEFIEWLPELEKHEQFYLSLLARSKYSDQLKGDKFQLKRFTTTKKRMLQKIKQLECAIGSYTHKGGEIPQNALALYIHPNPRDLEKAAKQSLIRFAHLVTEPYNNYNPHQEVMTQIQKSCSRMIYFDFDFDDVTYESILKELEGEINFDALTPVYTRGGFHLLINPKKIDPAFKKSWYKTISNLNGCDVRGDNLLPVIGCIQGGFVPHF